VETLVFIGRNLDPDDKGRLHFQDLESYAAGIRRDTSDESERATFYAQEEKHLNHIFKYEHALNELLRCSLRRQEHGLS
jgi:hypothetical protein